MLLPKPLYEIYCNKHHGSNPNPNQPLLSEDNMAEELAMRSSMIDSDLSNTILKAEQ
jgi:V-type H+-transporting ATPase subunit a